MFHVPEKCRVRHRHGREWMAYATTEEAGNNGLFFVQLRKGGPVFKIIATDGDGWEHVSISLPDRCPLWKEMCALKDLFWDEDDVVMQLHPAKSEHVNVHAFCLHLWRPTEVPIPTPPKHFV